MTMTPSASRFNHIVAFEVSKAELVIHTLPEDQQQRIPNTKTAVHRLLTRQIKLNRQHDTGPLLVVCEATGGYEHHVLTQATALGLDLHRAHGTRTRMFARYQGKRAKTDRIDARLIALYGCTPDLEPYRAPSREQETLKALRRRRDELVKMGRMETNRTEQVRLPRLKTSLKRHCKWLEAELKAIEDEINTLINTTPDLSQKAHLMQTVKGIGPKTAAAILAYMPEPGTLTKQKAASLAGLAPHAPSPRA